MTLSLISRPRYGKNLKFAVCKKQPPETEAFLRKCFTCDPASSGKRAPERARSHKGLQQSRLPLRSGEPDRRRCKAHRADGTACSSRVFEVGAYRPSVEVGDTEIVALCNEHTDRGYVCVPATCKALKTVPLLHLSVLHDVARRASHKKRTAGFDAISASHGRIRVRPPTNVDRSAQLHVGKGLLMPTKFRKHEGAFSPDHYSLLGSALVEVVWNSL